MPMLNNAVEESPLVRQTLSEGLGMIPVKSDAVERAVGYVRGAGAYQAKSTSFKLLFFPSVPIGYSLAAMVVCAIGISLYFVQKTEPQKSEIALQKAAPAVHSSVLSIPGTPEISKLRNELISYTASVSRMLSGAATPNQEVELKSIVQNLTLLVTTLDNEIRTEGTNFSQEYAPLLAELTGIQAQLALLSTSLSGGDK